MHGIILVGGEGTRLRPLTYGVPKAMVPILGRPFLEHMLVYLRRHGVTEISLALGHLPDSIVDYFGDGSRLGVNLKTAVEAQPLGSAGAIKQFEPELNGAFFALNGDVLTDFDLSEMRRRHERAGAAVSIALMEVDDTSGFGVVALDEFDRILRFVEKPAPDQAPSNWANAGVWLFQPAVLERVPAGQRAMVETRLFPELIAAGERVQGFTQQGFWVDIGTPQRYLDVQLRMLEHPELRILPLRPWPNSAHLCSLDLDDARAAASPPLIARDAIIEGPVLLGAGARVDGGAHIVGPAVIGDGCVVRGGARVERSVLWRGCVVAQEARIVRSTLAAGVTAGKGARLDGVTAGHHAEFGPGSELQNALAEPATTTG